MWGRGYHAKPPYPDTQYPDTLNPKTLILKNPKTPTPVDFSKSHAPVARVVCSINLVRCRMYIGIVLSVENSSCHPPNQLFRPGSLRLKGV